MDRKYVSGRRSNSVQVKHVVVCFRKGSFSGLETLEHLQMGLVAKAFDAKLSFILSDGGVLLAFNQQPKCLLARDIYGYFKSLSLYEIDNLVVEDISAAKFGINSANIIPPALIVSQKHIYKILLTADIVIDA